MVNIHDYAHNLARALRESPEYRSYKAAREKIKSNAAAKQMIEDFQRRRLELQALSLEGKEPSKEKQEALSQLLTVISGHADAREYLAAEQRFGVLMGDVYKIIGDAVELDLVPEPPAPQ